MSDLPKQSKLDNEADSAKDKKSEKATTRATTPPASDNNSKKNLEPKPQTESKFKSISIHSIWGISLFAFILSLISIAASIFFWIKSNNHEIWSKERHQILQSYIDVQYKQLQDTSARVDQLNTIVISDQNSIRELSQQSGKNPQYWLLHDVVYLLQLADLSLHYQHDVNGALALLESANSRLSQTENPDLLPLKQELANNIGQLKALPSINYAALITQLNAISDQIAKLPLATPTTNTTESTPQTPSTPQTQVPPKTTAWQNFLNENWQSLKNLIVIRYHSTPVEPLIAPTEQANIIRNIQLQIAQAQWALLRGNEELYQLSLNKAKEWITKFFNVNIKSTQSVLQTLDELLKQPIGVSLPELTTTQKLAQSLMEKTSTTPSSGPEGAKKE